MLRLILCLAILCATASPLFAQELTPPPPPPELDDGPAQADSNEDSADATPADSATTDDTEAATPDPDTPLAITAPIAGQRTGTSFVIQGTAPVGNTIEVRVNGELETRMKVDGTGTFEVAVSDLPAGSKVRIEVARLDPDGEVLTATSVVARTGEKTAEITPPPPAEPEVEETPPPPDDVVVERDTMQQQPEVRPMMGRLPRGALSTAGGVGLGFVGGITGFILGGVIALATSDGDGDFSELGYLLYGTIGGYLVGVPMGVYVTSYLLDGNGNIILTVLGTYAGLVAGALLSAATFGNLSSDSATLGIFTLTTTVGAATGALTFELTSDPSRRVKEAQDRQMTFTPTFAPSADGRGMVFGLGGTF